MSPLPKKKVHLSWLGNKRQVTIDVWYYIIVYYGQHYLICTIMSLSQKAKKATSVDLDVRRFDEKEADFFFWVGDAWLFNQNGSPILVCNWLKLFSYNRPNR